MSIEENSVETKTRLVKEPNESTEENFDNIEITLIIMKSRIGSLQ